MDEQMMPEGKTTIVEFSDIFKTEAANKIQSNSNGSLSELGIEVAKLGAMNEAIKDEGTREELKAREQERLISEVKADTIKSKTSIHKARSEKETTLYERYDYVFRLVGIKSKIPSFMCAIILVLYGVFGTALTLTFGLVFMTVNFIIDGITGIFGRISELLEKCRGVAKGFALTSVFLLILGVIALAVWLVLKYTIL